MSVVDQLKNLFSKKQPESELDSRLSLAMPDATVNSAEQETMQESQNAPLQAPAPSLADEPTVTEGDLISIPILGRRTVVQHQRTLFVLLGAALVVLAGVTFYALNQSDRVAQQLGATGQSLMQSQRLAKSVSQAVVGSAQAFPDVSDSSGILSKSVKGLQSGDDEMRINALSEDYAPELGKVIPLVERADKNAKAVIAQQKMLTQIGSALRLINRQSSDLLEVAETIASLKLQQNAPAAEISAVGQLVMLTQRIGKSSNEFLTAEGVSPEAVFLLGKDLNTFKEISEALLSGSTELRLTATKDAATREQLEALIKMYEETRVQAGAILGNLQGLVSAREAQGAIIADSEPLRRNLEDLQAKLSGQAGIGGASLALLVVAALFALVCAGGLSYVQLQDSRKRQVVAEDQRLEAERQEQEAKRVNDANQAAILRLMNELQTVAEGDLTQEATVTEDITGAIADSVNYTVEELRSLVSNVQNTAARVAQTTADVDATSTELLAASNEQLHEIRETGKSVLDMAGRINEVSAQAQESAAVARQSLQAAESGLQAVQNAIGGMNSIRDQIQETSKRIKRLGESSQEIGEITELISDITEQTNVLALNAAIQAASAGEAGRGFSVVAEEVQRLAERSADATRQIAALVKAIQTDTQDAIGAMERSTQGVVEGAKLSDNAGTALTEIDRVSRQVADLIEQISNAASREAGLANVVADNIQHIFAVTEQTGEGTRATANQVRELSRMAEELRQSVSRFKIS
ncbi:methyl-accepting chemotaxis protein [Rhodoferax mekongensis]|uniref:Methyl-accepting chemotaxis protein n=1 Tax=Rhodoferax mekongensis TaxID=3068341 RepID=A0ABZ0B4G3_9BURK|nr:MULTISPECIES: methyl-accepting chemotaxis protein [unclassified Rhodoferax]MDT7516656.1 methyl-accepting chemotaxis protein [Rhodoferax sp. TBRC 17199]WNO05959.1 methyl-accepting chemotaxis protein [Rhodoferax sp. TBRC 17307]